MSFPMPNLIPAYAEIWLLAAASVVLLVDLVLPDRQRYITYILSLLAVLGCGFFTLVTFQLTDAMPVLTFSKMFIVDPMAAVLKGITYIAVAVCFVYSRAYLDQRGMFRGEYFVLALFAMMGMMVMISGNHFLTLYLGLELMSLCLYALVALNRDSGTSTEAAMKYFVLGALASGLLLYGMSMIYGVTGSLEITTISEKLGALQPWDLKGPSSQDQRIALAMGLVFIVAGLAFKVGVVPFHMWIPDVYHGAPNAITLFIGTAPKIAAFAMSIRILVNGLLPLAMEWQGMLVILAVLSLAIGNIAGIAQTNIKRMLAYSTISHMGFMLLGLLSGVVAGGNYRSTVDAYGASMFYVIVYVLMTLGAFGMVLLMSRRGFEADQLEDFRGLNQRSPWYAFLMLILMFSLAGLPPTAGFYAKLAVLESVVAIGKTWLAVVAVMFSLIGAFYYLRVVKLMYFDSPQTQPALQPSFDVRLMISINGLALLALGILPQGLMDLCLASVKKLVI